MHIYIHYICLLALNAFELVLHNFPGISCYRYHTVECLLRNHIRLRVDQHVREGQGVLALKILAVLEIFSCFEFLEIHSGNWYSLPIFLIY